MINIVIGFRNPNEQPHESISGRRRSRSLSDPSPNAFNKEFQVQITQSVADKVEAIDEKLFDVYLVDFNLEDGNGCEIGDRVRSKGSSAPIIVVSGCDPKTVALKAGKLRLFDIIEKPFNRTTIADAVKKAMGPLRKS